MGFLLLLIKIEEISQKLIEVCYNFSSGNMNKDKLFNYFWICILASIIGYIVEGIYTLFPEFIWLNHSALVIGPFDLVYGIGAVLLTILLYKYKDDSIFKLFILGFIGGTIAEYIASWGMELVFGFSSWDYSNDFLNINGRVALIYSIFWGLLSVVWIKYIYPFLAKLINKINKPIWHKITIFLIIFLILDSILSMSAIFRANARDKGIVAQNIYEEFLDEAFPNKFMNRTYGYHWSE